MARSIRIQTAGAYYHVMARGNRREDIFHDDDDRRFFLHTLSQACEMTGWRVHAWVLMSNHYHLFIQTPEPNLVAGMSWLQNALTRRYNVRHRKWGRLFGDRYKAVIVQGEDRYHYQTLLDYIHLNPVRADLVDDPKDYRWCGYGAALGGDAQAGAGLAEVVKALPVAETEGLEPLPGYRVLLFGRGVERGATAEGEPIKKGFSREAARKVIAEGGKLERVDFLRCRVRYFTDGAVIGSREFVNAVFVAARERFGPKRKDGARRLAGLQYEAGLFSLRDLKRDPVT